MNMFTQFQVDILTRARLRRCVLGAEYFFEYCSSILKFRSKIDCWTMDFHERHLVRQLYASPNVHTYVTDEGWPPKARSRNPTSDRNYVKCFNVGMYVCTFVIVKMRAGKNIKNRIFLIWPEKIGGQNEVTWFLCLDSEWPNNVLHSDTVWNVYVHQNWSYKLLTEVMYAKTLTLMTSKSGPRGHSDLRVCVGTRFFHVAPSCTNFQENRKGPDTKTSFSVRFHVEWPPSECLFLAAGFLVYFRKDIPTIRNLHFSYL